MFCDKYEVEAIVQAFPAATSPAQKQGAFAAIKAEKPGPYRLWELYFLLFYAAKNR